MRVRLVGGVAALAAILPAGPGQAAPEPRVHTSWSVSTIPLDAGYLVEVVCMAEAHPANITEVAIFTAVTCSIDDYSQTQAAAGSIAVVTLTSAVMGPYTLCHAGEATFLDPVQATNRTITSGPDCRTVHP